MGDGLLACLAEKSEVLTGQTTVDACAKDTRILSLHEATHRIREERGKEASVIFRPLIFPEIHVYGNLTFRGIEPSDPSVLYR